MRIFDNRRKAEGFPENHAVLRELLAGVAGAEVDR
jgi:hypothetical protein